MAQTRCIGVFRTWQLAVPHIVHIVRPPTDNYTLPSASPRPRHSKIRKSDASHLGNKTTKHNSIERRHITAVNTQDLGNELEHKLMLSAARAVDLPQCSREFRNVITLRRKISYIITRQDGCHKLTFLRKDDQYFVTLNYRPWQWKCTGTMKHWHVRCEIWDLNSHGSAFSVPNPWGPLKPLFGSALPKGWMHV